MQHGRTDRKPLACVIITKRIRVVVLDALTRVTRREISALNMR